MMALSWHRHGKSGIRLVRVTRPANDDGSVPHGIVDLTIDVQLEGAFEAVYVDGDNRDCPPTDTMKNVVYAFARREGIGRVELFLLKLAEHFAGRPLVQRVRLSATEQRWERLTAGGQPHPHAFIQPGTDLWTAVVERDSNAAVTVTSGLTNLVVLKTTDSAFAGFVRDEFTTLPETDDRVLATSVTASWTYCAGVPDFSARERIRSTLLDVFAAHDSRSVQHTLCAMGEAALAACREISDITIRMPNRHHLAVDLAPFGLDNPNAVLVATDRPFGLIEATVRR
jgi:urate oxidase